jgi:hypothetical protein
MDFWSKYSWPTNSDNNKCIGLFMITALCATLAS